MTAVLELRALRKRFGPHTAVDSLDLRLRPHEFMTFLGPSGSGKTTTLMMVAGLQRPDAGSILLEAKGGAFDEIKLPNAKLVRAGTERDGRNNDLYLPPNPLKLEGRLTRLTYLIPEGRSPLEVIRGYQQLVRDGGGAVPWECAGAECGGSPATRATQGGSETGVIHMLYPYDLVAGNWTMCPLDENRAAQRYTLLDLPNGGGKAAVLSWTIGDVSAGSDCA